MVWAKGVGAKSHLNKNKYEAATTSKAHTAHTPGALGVLNGSCCGSPPAVDLAS